MATSRIDIFKQMLVSDPINSSILFGLAKEYEKVGQSQEMIETLERYLAIADDEGNAFGMLAEAYETADQATRPKKLISAALMPPLRTVILRWRKNIERPWQSFRCRRHEMFIVRDCY